MLSLKEYLSASPSVALSWNTAAGLQGGAGVSMMKRLYEAIVERIAADHPDATPAEIHDMAVMAYERGLQLRDGEMEEIPEGHPAAGRLPVPTVPEVRQDAAGRGGPSHQTHG